MDQRPSQTPKQPQAASAAPNTNTGQTLGIIGIILPFVGFGLIGLVLSIISLVQASKARTSKTLGIVGIILNVIFGIIFGLVVLFIITTTAYNGIQNRAKTSETQSVVNSIAKKAETYKALHDSYPQSAADFESDAETSLAAIDTSLVLTENTPDDSRSIQYKACGKDGAEVVYFDPSRGYIMRQFVGNGSSATCAS